MKFYFGYIVGWATAICLFSPGDWPSILGAILGCGAGSAIYHKLNR